MEDFHSFVTQLVQRGISRKNRFRVTIPLPAGIFDDKATSANDTNAWKSTGKWTDYLTNGFKIVNAFYGGAPATSKSLQAMCMMASLPGVNIDTTPMSSGGNHIKIPNNKSQTDVDFSFLLATDFYEKNVMDNWKKLIYDPYTTKLGYYEDFVTDICIEQLDSEDNVVHRVYLVEAMPVAFNQIDLDKGATDQFQQMTISFTYNKFLSDTQYEQRSATSDFLPFGIADALTSGDWITAASKAGQLVKKIKDGNFTGEALMVYRQLDKLIQNSAGVSLADFERVSQGLSRDIGGNDKLSAAEKTNLLSLLKDVF